MIEPETKTWHTRHPRPLRRWATRLVFLVVVATTGNVTISTLLALSLTPMNLPATADSLLVDRFKQSLDVYRPAFQPDYFQGIVLNRAQHHLGSWVIIQQNYDDFTSNGYSAELREVAAFDQSLPHWSTLQERDPIIESFDAIGFDNSSRQYVEVATGWPWVSMRAEVLRGTSNDFANGAWELPGRLFDDGLTRVVPLRPIPREFALNTVVIAAALFALALFARAILWDWRRTLRRRGRCGACGYDRRGLDGSRPCPECGAGTGRRSRVVSSRQR